MKSKNIITLVALLVLSAATATAQKNIRQAFDALVSHAGSDMSHKSSLTRDPETNRKTGQYDVYDFKLPKKDKSYVTAIEAAFRKDREGAYDVVSGTSDGRSYTYTSLAVGDGSGSGIAIGKIPKSKYIYALFLDKDDPEQKYRTAYALEWKEDGNSIVGRLAVTYATTLKYRQQQEKGGTRSLVSTLKGLSFNGNTLSFTTGGSGKDEAELTEDQKTDRAIEWLGEFVMYRDLCESKLEQESSSASVSVAELYKHCRDKRAKYLTPEDRQTALDELAKLKLKVKDNLLKTMLQRAMEQLK